jgi:hypothetical protein
MFFKGILLSGIGNRRRAPLAVADVVLDILLRDLRVRCPRSPHRVGIDIGGADAVTLGRGESCCKYADSGTKNEKKGSHSHMVVTLGKRTRIQAVCLLRQ